MFDDAELLRRYAVERSEGAFAELVRRRLDLVYAIALRQVGGDAHLAADVAQRVFTDLARKAASLSRRPFLTTWLYRSTRFTASDVVRSERRRRVREQRAQDMVENNIESARDHDWQQLRPLIDEAMLELGGRTRDLLMLRFFESLPFAAIGARFGISEDAARIRVQRALDRMRALLARRGVHSTAAGLGMALSCQPAIAAPAGLAANITSAAVASAAAEGAGIAGLILTFMNSAKISGVGTAALLLGCSLVGNAYLYSRARGVEAGAPPFRPVIASTPDPAPATPPGPVSLVKSADLSVFRDRLREAGASETAVRIAVEGILFARYRETVFARNAERRRQAWWRDAQLSRGTPGTPMLTRQLNEDIMVLYKMVTLGTEELLGPNPLHIAETKAKYDFLPPELQEEFRLAEAAFAVFPSQPTGDLELDFENRRAFMDLRQAAGKRHQELLGSLTPEQRTTYEMRFGQLTSSLSGQFALINPTKNEFLAVYPLADAYARAQATPGTMENRVARDQEMVQSLVAELGFERALDFIWGGTMEYRTYDRVATDAGLPAGTASRVLQLGAETAKRAIAIHSDGTLSLEQKKSSLKSLQNSVQPRLDALLPPAAQARLGEQELEWIRGLENGRYKPVAASLPGRRGMQMHRPISVDAPAPPPQVRQIVPVRPGSR